MRRVAVTCTHLIRDIDDYRQTFTDAGLDVFLPAIPGQELRGDDLASAMEGIVGVIAGDDHFTSDVMGRLPELKAISKWGIGLDGIDLDNAAERGITVTNTPGMFGNEVAELAIAYLFALVRDIVNIDRTVRAGGWPKQTARSMDTLTAHVIGLGDIGRTLGEKLLALGLSVTGSDPSVEAASWGERFSVTVGDAETLAAGADVVIICAPLNAATNAMVDAQFIAGMRPGSWLINVGRGPIVLGSAVADGIESGHLKGAALDVFEVEPLEDDRLRNLPNLILGAHNGSNTFEACHRTHVQAIRNLIDNLPA